MPVPMPLPVLVLCLDTVVLFLHFATQATGDEFRDYVLLGFECHGCIK